MLMVELKNKVDELALHNEYQLRLKDMNYSEKIKVCTFLWQASIFPRVGDSIEIHFGLAILILSSREKTHPYLVRTNRQEITEKFTQDLEQSKNKFELLRYAAL